MAAFDLAKRRGYEGIVAKNPAAPYRAGRSKQWCKVKLRQEGEFVIGGCVGAGERFEKLLVGAYKAAALRYVGEVEFGLARPALWEAFESLVVPHSPFNNLARKRNAVWLAPRLVAELTFQEWMEGSLRHPCFRAISAERRPEECRLIQAA